VEIINTTNLLFAPLVGRVNFPDHSLSLIVKGTFDLKNRTPAKPAAKQLYPSGDKFYPDDENSKSLWYESDFAHYKPCADLLFVGKCHTPNSTPRQTCKVTFQVGDTQNSLAVFGDRYWHNISKTISSPDPFTVMDIRYENSFGGEGYKKNPLGRGLKEIKAANGQKIIPLPNIENISQLINSPDNRPEPAGFGPLDKMWQQRFSKIGSCRKSWQEERWPWFPVDFSWKYYNAAPPCLQLQKYLKGNEYPFF